jgi:hypothetical protein
MPDVENIPLEDCANCGRGTSHPFDGAVNANNNAKYSRRNVRATCKPKGRAEAKQVRDEEVEPPREPVWKLEGMGVPARRFGVAGLHGGILEDAVGFGKRGSGFPAAEKRGK